MLLNVLKVRGEIGTFSKHINGHIFVTLKDDFSKIQCVIFAWRSGKYGF